MVPEVAVCIADELFVASFQWDLARNSCERLLAMLPYSGELMHARWSGEALWSPLGSAWTPGSILPRENATQCPGAGEILLYAGVHSEPELLIPYGTCRFGSKAGALEGNPVLLVEKGIDRLAALGAEAQRRGALELTVRLLNRS